MLQRVNPSVYRIGDVEVDTGRACVRKGGRECHVRARTFQVLVYLLENRDRLVTREEILRDLWGGAAVTDDVLTQCVGDLRRALGDDPRHPVYIKTIPKLGFRVVGEVELLPAALPAAQAEVEMEATTEVHVEIRETRSAAAPRWITLAAALVGAALLLYYVRREPAAATTAPDKTPVAVMFFEDRSGRPDLYWLREGLADMLITNLSRSPKLAPLPREHVRQLLERAGEAFPNGRIPLDRALEAARRGHAPVMILGAFAVLGNGLRLDTQIYEVASGRLVTGESLATDNLGDLLAKFDTLTLRVAIALQAPLPGAGRARRMGEARTANLEAFRAYSLGVERVESFRVDEALDLFRKAIQLDPQFAMAHARLGYTYSVTAGKSAEGKPHLEKAFSLAGGLTERDRLYVTAWYAIAQEDFQEAIAVYRRILDEYPGEISGYVSLARLLRGEGQINEALAVLQKGKAIDPGWGDIHNLLSGVYFQLGRKDQSVASARRYVELAPSEPNTHDTLGLIYQRAGQYPEALASYRQALQLKPDFEMTVIHLANVYCELGRYRDAIAQFRRFEQMTRFPFQRTRAREAIAWVHWRKRDMRAAARELEVWPPDSPPPQIRVVLDAGPRGLKGTIPVVTPAPQRGINARGSRLTERAAFYFAGAANLRNGRTEEALRNFRDAVERLPPYWGQTDFEDCLADAYLELHRWDEAIAEYRRVLAINPNRALARYHLGVAFANRGNQAAARVELSRFLEIWKDADNDLPEVVDAGRRLRTEGSLSAAAR